jgi:hypothetical protein
MAVAVSITLPAHVASPPWNQSASRAPDAGDVICAVSGAGTSSHVNWTSLTRTSVSVSVSPTKMTD